MPEAPAGVVLGGIPAHDRGSPAAPRAHPRQVGAPARPPLPTSHLGAALPWPRGPPPWHIRILGDRGRVGPCAVGKALLGGLGLARDVAWVGGGAGGREERWVGGGPGRPPSRQSAGRGSGPGAPASQAAAAVRSGALGLLNAALSQEKAGGWGGGGGLWGDRWARGGSAGSESQRLFRTRAQSQGSGTSGNPGGSQQLVPRALPMSP